MGTWALRSHNGSPEEAHELGGAHAVVKGDGDLAWVQVLDDCLAGRHQLVYEGGRVEPEHLRPARWDLMPTNRYMWASVQTVRGCPKHCSFCSVWKTDGQRPRQRTHDRVVREVVELRRKGFRFIALADAADDNPRCGDFEEIHKAATAALDLRARAFPARADTPR